MKGALLREWAILAGAGAAALAAAAAFRPWSLALSLPVWAWCLFLLYRGLSDNRRPGEDGILPELGAPTRVTMFRALLVAIASGFLFSPAVAAPAYSAAAILDSVDGKLARARKRETLLGSTLDMEVDAAGILAASVSGIVLGKLPLAYAVIGLARYLFVLATSVEKRAGGSIRDLDPSRVRRLLAGFQMGFLAVALWPQIPETVTRPAAYLFGASTLAMFLRDWLFVTHRLR